MSTTGPARAELERFRRIALEIAGETRAAIGRALGGDLAPRLKPDDSFVTDVDVAVEDLVRARLAAELPDHGILGEEREEVPARGPYRWVVDPIDGTHSLRHGIPLYGTLLALRCDGRTIVGVIDLPGLDRTYVAAEGLGATCNGKALTIRDVESEDAVRHEILAAGDRKQFARIGRTDVFDRLMRLPASVRTYCDCFGHALAIEGRVGAMVDYGLRLWDVAPTELLVREAGGKFVRVAGDPAERYDVVFGKPTVVDWVLRELDA